MSPAPFVSIVTPCRNARAYLAETIASVAMAAEQAGVPVEHLVIDGGSTDGTVEMLAGESRVSRWVSEPDDGPYDAVAKGLEMARGEVLAWLNAGDLFVPQALRTVGEVFGTLADVSWISTRTTLTLSPSGSLAGAGHLPGFARRAFLDGVYLGRKCTSDPLASDFIQQESTFWRRGLWATAGGAEVIRRWRLAGDFALWAAFFRHAPCFAMPAPLGIFRMDDSQRSFVHFEAYLAECQQILAEMRAEFDYTPPTSPDLQWYKGWVLMKADPRSRDPDWGVGLLSFGVMPEGDMKEIALDRRLA